jgi:O-6-methylguanine DNA methyltransferase
MADLVWKQVDSSIGTLTLCRSDKGLCHIEFGTFAEHEQALTQWAGKWWPNQGRPKWQEDESCSFLNRTAEQLASYFTGETGEFDIPLDLQGTPFQQKVWQALLDIQYGEVRSYKAVAEAIGQPLAVRAVGGANNRNPVPILVPCHRVIGANGTMVGYGGGMAIKTHLLALERR